MTALRLGTRGSALALWQTRRIASWLQESHAAERVEEVVISTRGDADRTSPLPEIGGAGVFTRELEDALRSGHIHAAVHSLKDLPIEDRPGLRLGAICLREDAHDALVTADGRRLDDLPDGARVGTSSPRRAAQLAQVRPDLQPAPIRGNVETRIAKVDRAEFDAVILAAAGLRRLGLESRITERLDLDAFTPAPGQGALAVQCRADDDAMLELLTRIDDDLVRACTTAERAFLGGLGGGCSLPVGAYAEIRPDGAMHLRGFAGSIAGAGAIRVSGSAAPTVAAELGRTLAREAIAAGALDLLP